MKISRPLFSCPLNKGNIADTNTSLRFIYIYIYIYQGNVWASYGRYWLVYVVYPSIWNMKLLNYVSLLSNKRVDSNQGFLGVFLVDLLFSLSFNVIFIFPCLKKKIRIQFCSNYLTFLQRTKHLLKNQYIKSISQQIYF